jgi:hypothetical protein
MAKFNGLELKRARLVPSSMFASPEAVVRSADLSRAQKIQILRRWEFDARRTLGNGSVGAFGETFGDDRMLTQVQGALSALGALPSGRGRADPARH